MYDSKRHHLLRNFYALCCFLFISLVPVPAAAQVVMTFYSRELGTYFPHAFVILKGQTVKDKIAVDTNYGFTPKAVTPAMLFTSVGGRIDIATAEYIEHSNPHFSVTLSDDQYAAVLAVVEKWRGKQERGYNLNTANCVHFVGEIAQAVGLTVTFPKKLMKKPRSYVLELQRLNPGVHVINPP